MKKKQKIHVVHVGTHKKTVTVLWAVLIISVCFGVYKNFTAVDRHTVHEKEVIKEQLLDTNSIENFVLGFAKVYYSWENDKLSLDNRTKEVNSYLTEELQNLNLEVIRQDIPTKSIVKDVSVWSVENTAENEYVVTYSVTQNIKEGKKTKEVVSYYTVKVYADAGDMVITKNPTIASGPGKSSYAPKLVESDNSVDVSDIKDATAFLKRFFKLYPNSSKEELVYYVKDEALKPVEGDYIFADLINPVFVRDEGEEEDILCHVAVKYLDNQTKAAQISQYSLKLHKGENWMIVGLQ